MRRRRARVGRPAMWSWCSCVMRMAERAAGSSLAVFMRLSNSRQERPASTSRLVSAEEMTVELPLEPEARTVMRMRLRYAGLVWICGRRGKSESQRTRSKRGSWLGRDSYGSADRRCESGLLWGGAERRRASLGGLKEIDRKNADQRLQRVAKAGLYGDEVVGNRQQQERPSEIGRAHV